LPSAAPTAVAAHRVSKFYKLYADRGARVLEALNPWGPPRHSTFRALDDVSFEVPAGASLGILGVNGSGKSTLLQIIGGIIPATSGSVQASGRIAALIELGAGFNPDMTGRENVRINAAILGMSPSEIDDRMESIEAFADVGEFFDQPVKTHSSGMLARVAFAMAIHVDPDILIIDEALAVGDARFQQKCFRRFRGFQEAGKTILLVTHDRFSVPRLCSHGLVLDRGRLAYFGEAGRATEVYGDILTADPSRSRPPRPAERSDGEAGEPAPTLEQLGSQEEVAAFGAPDEADPLRVLGRGADDLCPMNPLYNPNEYRSGDGAARIVEVQLSSGGAVNPETVIGGEALSLLVRVAFLSEVEHPNLGITLKTKDGLIVFGTNAYWLGDYLSSRRAGSEATYRVTVHARLGSGDWFLTVALASRTDVLHDSREGVLHFRYAARKPAQGLAEFPTKIVELADTGWAEAAAQVAEVQ
jgi:lipopolysaccharide transport system ATP-binding protein